MSDKTPMTVRGAEMLEDELQHLKRVDRPRIIAAIAEARAHGDLSENAEYHAAREQQSFAEGRIGEIQGKLANAQIIDVTTINAGGRVVFGATVTMLNIETNAEVSYRIVGDDESDIEAGQISVNSPIARAMIAKSEEDVVVVNTPGGEVEYEILSVEYI